MTRPARNGRTRSLGEGEWVNDYERVICYMVGDDRPHEFELDQLAPLEPEKFCWTCGQVGCTHNVYA